MGGYFFYTHVHRSVTVLRMRITLRARARKLGTRPHSECTSGNETPMEGTQSGRSCVSPVYSYVSNGNDNKTAVEEPELEAKSPRWALREPSSSSVLNETNGQQLSSDENTCRAVCLSTMDRSPTVVEQWNFMSWDADAAW